MKTFETKEAFAKESAEVIARACHTNFKKDSIPTYIGFSGGKTPSPVYRYFASQLAPGMDAHIYGALVDERYVPTTAPTSNWRVIKRDILNLLPKGKKEHTNPVAMIDLPETDKPVDQAVTAYQKHVRELLVGGATFDLVILGIGEDGHVASLFPHSPALSTSEWVAHTMTNNPPVKDRITMTFPLIMQAKKILLLASGGKKKAILDRLINGNEAVTKLPAKKLLEHPNLMIHYLVK